MQYNHAMVTQLFGPLSNGLVNAIIHNMSRADDAIISSGKLYCIAMYSDGTVEVLPEPKPKLGGDHVTSYLCVDVYNLTRDQVVRHTGGGISVLSITVPMYLLTDKPRKYFVYRLSFQGEVDGQIDNISSFQSGYIGITKRNPFIRFKEHQRLSRDGEGHLLHKAWNGLIKSRQARTLNFTIADHFKTLDEAYGAEERLVETFTLNPKGLNVIPGGHSGIRMLHKLKLLNCGSKQVSVADRDEALVRLEQRHDRNSPCAHYRSGHFRKLPAGKLTWVSPCFVNPSTIT